MMEHTGRSPWLAVSVGIIGLVIGYGLVIAQRGPEAFAKASQCRAPKMTECVDGNCAHDDCASGKCDGNCPGCSSQPSV